MPRLTASVTTAFVVLVAVGFVAMWLTKSPGVVPDLTFLTRLFADRPWTPLTYPFDGSAGLFGVLFATLWMLMIGNQVESELGSLRFGIVIALFTVLCPLFIWIGSIVTKEPGGMNGPWVTVEGVTIMWATRYPETELRLYAILPIKAKYLGWFGAAIIFFGVTPILTPFLIVPLIGVWAFAANKIPFLPYGRPRANTPTARYRKHWKEDENYFSDVKRREKERDERERLRKLFEGGSVDEKDDR